MGNATKKKPKYVNLNGSLYKKMSYKQILKGLRHGALPTVIMINRISTIPVVSLETEEGILAAAVNALRETISKALAAEDKKKLKSDKEANDDGSRN